MAELLPFRAAPDAEISRPGRQGPTSDPPAADAPARALALMADRSFAVEAPAGSGKTTLLIRRFLTLLADPAVVDPREVMAVTFTRKAAGEMRSRLLALLRAAASDDAPAEDFDQEDRPLAAKVVERDRALGWDLLRQPTRLNVRTLDSLAGEIARTLPLLTGSGSRERPTDNADELYGEAARRTILLLGGADARLNEALRILLRHRDGNLGNCERLIAEMLGLREQWQSLVPLESAQLDDFYLDTVVLPRMERALEEAICRGLAHLAETIPPAVLDDLCRLARSLSERPPYRDEPHPLDICSQRAGIPGATAADLEHWQALIKLLMTKGNVWRAGFNSNHLLFEATKADKALLSKLIDEIRVLPDLHEAFCTAADLPPARYPVDAWGVVKALFRVLSRAVAELGVVFSERGLCDFIEGHLLALKALGRAESPALSPPLRHLLVDEMQDTSTGQYDLLRRLTQGWDGRTRTVLLVGDPKQSIYSFRQARVERFVRTLSDGRLGELPLEVLRLSTNFRSERGLVEAFNAGFGRLFPGVPEPGRPERVTYAAAEAARPRSLTLGMEWHIQALEATGETEENARERRRATRADAETIRRLAEAWRTKGLPAGRTRPWTLAVLVRNRTHLIEVTAALRAGSRAGPPVPFRAVDIERLGERREILDLLALTRALLHPGDRTAWLALLRTPWCGLTLSDLLELTGADDPAFSRQTIAGLLRERAALLSPEGQARLGELAPLLEHALTQRGHLPMAHWVERTWRVLGGHRGVTAEVEANVTQYLRLLEELAEPGGGIDLRRLRSRLHRLFAAPSSAPGAVDLMTIHAAKGLEWDVVFVPGLNRSGRSQTGRLLSWTELQGATHAPEESSASGIVAPIVSKGAEGDALVAWLKALDLERTRDELTRLFYVACTRAKEELHLFASLAPSASGTLAPRAGTLLHTAWKIAEEQVRQASPKNVISLPRQAVAAEMAGGLALAAGADADAQSPPARSFAFPLLRATLPARAPHARDASAAAAPPSHPAASFSARALGNGLHIFLDRMSRRVRDGATLEDLRRELNGLLPRIEAVLRSEGVPPGETRPIAASVLLGLDRTLASPQGAWLLGAHPGGASEVSFHHPVEGTIRVDRLFHAGPEPERAGAEFLWIVDFKTGTHGAEGLERFLADERATYQAQLERYGRALRAQAGPVRLALFHPLVGRLTWWAAETPAATG